jgi:hypothetical protein
MQLIKLLRDQFFNSYNDSLLVYKLGISKSPPNWFKQEFLLSLIRKYKIENVVETGTYKGETTIILSKNAKNVFTIEPYEPLHRYLDESFENRENIKLFKGRSEDYLEEILKMLPDSNNLFYLDSHYSGESTFLDETNESALVFEYTKVLRSNKFKIIVIDDAREVVGSEKSGYGNLEMLQNEVECSQATMELNNDQICIVNS